MRSTKRSRNYKAKAPTKNRYEVAFYKGHRLAVPNHPTEFDAIPWYQLVVRILNPTLDITYGTVYNNLVSQLGISVPNAVINVRLMSIRVWGPIPTTNTRLTMTVEDVFDNVSGSTPAGAQQTLEEISDYADAVNRARVGYTYSTAQQQVSLLMTGGATDSVCRLAGAGVGSVAYVLLLWRPYRITGPPPALASVVSSDDEVEIITTRRKPSKLLQ